MVIVCMLSRLILSTTFKKQNLPFKFTCNDNDHNKFIVCDDNSDDCNSDDDDDDDNAELYCLCTVQVTWSKSLFPSWKRAHSS